MAKNSRGLKSDRKIVRKLDGINLRRDIRIFQPEKEEKKDFQNFYTDLDRRRKSKASFVWSMITIFLILFSLLVYGFWSLHKYSINSGMLKNNDEAETYLTDKVSESLASKKPGELVTVIISESELANFMGVGGPDFPLKKSSLEIKGDGIYISGRTGDGVLSLPVTIVAIPKADGGKLKIELSKASSGIVTLPLTLKNALNDYFENKVGTYTSDIGRIEVKEVVLKDKQMNLIGTAL